jgi:threonine aldolase
MVDRLADDHANAEALAAGLAEVPGIEVESVGVRTDIVFFRILRSDMDAVSFCERLNENGIRMADMDLRRVRAVTNYHVTRADIDTTLDAVREILV